MKWFLAISLFVLSCRFPPLVCSTPGKIHTPCKLSRQGNSLKEVIIRRFKLAVRRTVASLENLRCCILIGIESRERSPGCCGWQRSSISFSPPCDLAKCCSSLSIYAHLPSFSILTREAQKIYSLRFFCLLPICPFPLLQMAFLHERWQPPASIVRLQMQTATHWAQLPLGRREPSWDWDLQVDY